MSFGPPVISYSSVTCLRSSSFLLHSLYLFSSSSFQYSLALVSFPHLNLANILLSFHFIIGTLVIFLWLYFCSVYYIWIPLALSPLFCFSLSSFFCNLVCCHADILSCSLASIYAPPFLTFSSRFFLFLALFPSWPFPTPLLIPFSKSIINYFVTMKYCPFYFCYNFWIFFLFI